MLKWVLLLLPNEAKDYVSVKKRLEGDGYWTCIKELIVRTLNIEAGTVALLDRKRQDILTLFDLVVL